MTCSAIKIIGIISITEQVSSSLHVLKGVDYEMRILEDYCNQ